MVQTDLAEKKKKKKNILLSKTGNIWWRVFSEKISIFTWFVSTRTTINIINNDTMKGKKNKNYSPLVEINSTVEQIWEGLLDDTGRSLQALLKADFPDVDAVCSAVEKIKYLLEDNPVDICDRWVSAHVVADNVNRFISNRNVRAVSILFIFCFNCT